MLSNIIMGFTTALSPANLIAVLMHYPQLINTNSG